MSYAEAQMLGPITIGYRCTSNQHDHYKRNRVDELFMREAIRWHGRHCRVAYWTEHRTWQGKQSKMPHDLLKPGLGSMGVMQLILGLPGRKR